MMEKEGRKEMQEGDDGRMEEAGRRQEGRNEGEGVREGEERCKETEEGRGWVRLKGGTERKGDRGSRRNQGQTEKKVDTGHTDPFSHATVSSCAALPSIRLL